MLLYSIGYIIFLSVVFALYYSLPKKFQPFVILVSSLVFCGFFNYNTLITAVLCLLIFYVTGVVSGKVVGTSQKTVILTGIILSVLVLIFLKYFLDTIRHNVLPLHLNVLGIKFNIALISIQFGVSYYMFTGIGYLIELYNQRIQPEKNILAFSNFILFFPKFSLGPIERSKNLLVQLKTGKEFNYEMTTAGLKLILWGLFKKTVLAERLLPFVENILSKPDNAGGPALLIALIFYSFQIYADFSGYTDIARGSAKLFGYNLIDNFKRPYFSKSVSEFWTRWHISLSSWLRDYIFVPLALMLNASRLKLIASNNNLIYLISTSVTMLIIGLWHGTGIGFIIWSLLHIIYLYTGFILKKKKAAVMKKYVKPAALRNTLSVITTFVLVTFAWLFFRAENYSAIVKLLAGFTKGYTNFSLGSLLHSAEISGYKMFLILLFTSFFFLTEFILEKRGSVLDFLKKRNAVLRFAFYLAFIFFVIYFSVSADRFIYFQF